MEDRGTTEKITKYMTFKLVQQKPKTAVWHVLNKSSGNLIGIIEWYSPWRQYCFFPQADTIFNSGCLLTIIEFMSERKTWTSRPWSVEELQRT